MPLPAEVSDGASVTTGAMLSYVIERSVPVTAAIIWVTYFSNDRIARQNASQLIERFRIDAVDNIQDDINPIRSLIRSAAALGDQLPSFYEKDQSLPYFHSMVLHSDKIVSAYVGLADGSFRQARRIDPGVRIFNDFPPAGSAYASRVIEPAKAPPTLDRYTFFDAAGKKLGEEAAPTNYDPRSRGWYRNTARAGTLRITDPDVFAALGLIGITVAAPYSGGGGEVRGVVAIDITLDSFSQYLADRKVSPGSLSFILDSQGRVIGTEVVTSSGQPELDRRAQAIASRAGPFGAFTVDMKRQTDLLALVSRFSFTRDHRLQTELTGP